AQGGRLCGVPARPPDPARLRHHPLLVQLHGEAQLATIGGDDLAAGGERAAVVLAVLLLALVDQTPAGLGGAFGRARRRRRVGQLWTRRRVGLLDVVHAPA